MESFHLLLRQIHISVLDNAMTDISTGSLDHNTVIKRAISELTNSGLRTIDYASGRSIRVESAVRMAVMTGITQVTAKVNDMNAEALVQIISKCHGMEPLDQPIKLGHMITN